MHRLKTAVIVGSNRRDSINRRLAEAMVGLVSEQLDATFVRIDDLPLYNQDLEDARPAEVDRFTAEVAAADALLIVTPEHNRSIPAVLKSALDWGSKPMDRNVWRHKVAAIAGASPGPIAAAVGQQHLRQILGILGSHVIGGEAYITFRPELITDDGAIANEGTREFLRAYMANFVRVGSALACAPS